MVSPASPAGGPALAYPCRLLLTLASVVPNLPRGPRHPAPPAPAVWKPRPRHPPFSPPRLLEVARPSSRARVQMLRMLCVPTFTLDESNPRLCHSIRSQYVSAYAAPFLCCSSCPGAKTLQLGTKAPTAFINCVDIACAQTADLMPDTFAYSCKLTARLNFKPDASINSTLLQRLQTTPVCLHDNN